MVGPYDRPGWSCQRAVSLSVCLPVTESLKLKLDNNCQAAPLFQQSEQTAVFTV